MQDTPVRRYGGLKDQDRIFTNAFCRHDHGLKGAQVRFLPPLPFPPLLFEGSQLGWSHYDGRGR